MEFRFNGLLDRQEGGFQYHQIALPAEASDAFKQAGIKRVLVRAAGHTYRRALISDGQGGSFVIFSKEMIKDTRAKLGATLALQIEPDPDPDALDIPEEFAELMAQDEAVAAGFRAMTPGRQRSLLIYITQAKGAETRLKRAIELGQKIVSHNLYDDRKARGEFD